MIPFARNLSYLGTGEDLRKATTHLLAHTLASTMDRVDAYLVGNWRRQARFKLQDDAVATSILGRLCEQFPEVFQTHVMPHLQDADLGSLIVLVGRGGGGHITSISSRLVCASSPSRTRPIRAQHGLRAPGCAPRHPLDAVLLDVLYYLHLRRKSLQNSTGPCGCRCEEHHFE